MRVEDGAGGQATAARRRRRAPPALHAGRNAKRHGEAGRVAGRGAGRSRARSTGHRDERPRERLLAAGAASLTDAELIAVLLGAGCRGLSAIELGRALLSHFGSLRAMLGSPPAMISGVRGIGAARAAQLAAVVEITRRMLDEELRDAPANFGSPGPVRDFLRLSLAAREHEVFVVLLLDSQNRLIRSEELFRGTLTQTSVYPREVVKLALLANAAGAIFAHNHPSGVAEPSRADETLTLCLRNALALVDVRTLDHFVVAGPHIVSMAERGLL